MVKAFETYRGVVNAWECDVVEHFTIAYYFDRFADATRNFYDLIGGDASTGTDLAHGSSRRHVTFQAELRAGAGFHILSSVTGIDANSLQLGHQVIESTTGEPVTWVAETHALPAALTATKRRDIAALAVEWPGPRIPDRPVQESARGMLTARDRVKSSELDESEVMSLSAQIHRFSAGGMQALAAIGMTADYMHKQRRGFSTFELDLMVVAGARAGEMIDVATSVAHLGKSSLRFLHRMTGLKGRKIAFLAQSGVHLDMDARRSAALPNELRAGASRLMTYDP